jgi:hypothetical protein
LGNPLILDGLELFARLAGLLTRHHEVVQWLQVGIGRANDEGVIAVVDGRGDECCGFRVGTGNGKQVGSWGLVS